MYVNQKMSSTKIGEIMGVAKMTILRKLKILGISIRSSAEAQFARHTQRKRLFKEQHEHQKYCRQRFILH